jgi:outer membrane protein TolC
MLRPSARPRRRPGSALPALAALLVAAATAVHATAPAPPATALTESAAPAPAAGPTAGAMTVEEGLRQVLDDALAANLELRAGSATVGQRVAALDQARARYLPSIDFGGRYTVADGGRTIELPLGDLLNPVYATLDQLLVASGQPPAFPRVENQSIPLLREREQETRFALEQPIYEPRLAPAVTARQEDLSRAESGLVALRGRVIRDVKQAYYQWLAGQQAVLVLEATRELAQANLDANQSLYRNGKVTRDLVLRAEADLLEIEQNRLAAASRVRIAQSYVNLLRNAPLATPLPGAQIDEATIERFRVRLVRRLAGRAPDTPQLQELAMQQRAEIKSLDSAVAGSEALQDLARAAFRPRLVLGAEAGVQGDNYEWGEDARYALASVILRWNLFRGGADRAALREARAYTDELLAARELASQQVRLEVQQAVEGLEVAGASLDTALKRVEAADGTLRIASRKRDLGQINQAEFIDARRTMTDARLNLTRVRAEFLARIAELEFAVGDRRAALEDAT